MIKIKSVLIAASLIMGLYKAGLAIEKAAVENKN